MQLTVVWHKLFWPSSRSPTGFASHGGLNRQIEALAELFDATRIVGACVPAPDHAPGERALSGRNVTVVALSGLPRPFPLMWLMLPFWFLRNGFAFTRAIARADAVFPALPSPVGLLGLLLAVLMRKRLFIRPTTNWRESNLLWRLERAFFERIAGGRIVVMASGGGEGPPSKNQAVGWIFSTTMSEAELTANAIPRRLEPGRARLVIVGRELEAEGTRVMLLALPRLARAFPDVTLDVVGHGSALPKLMRLARELAVDGRVTFHGAMSHANVLALLRRVDVFCLPTVETESARQTVIEALGSGLPVVAAPMSFLAGQTCGVLLSDNTPEAVAEAVAFCLSEPERYRLMSIEARRVAQGYSLERWRAIIRARLEQAWGPLKRVETRLPAEALP